MTSPDRAKVKVFVHKIDVDDQRIKEERNVHAHISNCGRVCVKLNRLTTAEIEKYTEKSPRKEQVDTRTKSEEQNLNNVECGRKILLKRRQLGITSANADRSTFTTIAVTKTPNIMQHQMLKSLNSAISAQPVVDTTKKSEKRKLNDVEHMTRIKRRKLVETSSNADTTTLTTNAVVKSPNTIQYESPKLLNLTTSTQPVVDAVEPNTDMTMALMPYAVGEVVWGKIRGWPHWPARIIRILPRLYEVEWFNDFRTTKLYRSQMLRFRPNFTVFVEKFDTTIGLREAAEQAMMYLVSGRRGK